jgi:hypothetical protein
MVNARRISKDFDNSGGTGVVGSGLILSWYIDLESLGPSGRPFDGLKSLERYLK